MNYDEINKILAPCGLNYMKCQMFGDGNIKRYSAELSCAGFWAPSTAMRGFSRFFTYIRIIPHSRDTRR